MRELDGAVAVVTGGGSGIGRATAHALARRGCRLVVADLDAERATTVAAEVGGLGLRCDVRSTDDVEALLPAALDRFGRVDVVMSNVGVLAKGLPTEIPLEAWQEVVDVNLLGMVRVVRAFVPSLLAQGHGHVVLTGSTAGLFPYAYDRLPYAATKGAVIAMAEALALWLRPQGVGVTCVCPAGVITNIVEQVREYGPQVPMQAPQIPIVSAEEMGELVVAGIVDDELLVLSHPEAGVLLREHDDDRTAFLDRQISLLGGAT